jgi:adenylate cyclase
MLFTFPLRSFIRIVVAGIIAGAFYAGIQYGAPMSGAAAGGQISAALFALEQYVLRRNAGGVFRPLPFLQYLALRSLLYVTVIFIIVALPPRPPMAIESVDFLFTLVLVVGASLLLSVNDLLGPGVLFAFAAGRYYEPRIEERALLFIDMRSSTATAERLGELRFLKLLNRFIIDLTLAIDKTGGEIHKYVGDEVIVTWRLGSGQNEAACVRACFAVLNRLGEQAPAYEREFGVAADFRAGLHCGRVAVGEVGSLKKEIALIGDTMNTAQRIQEACRDTNHRVLASAALIDRLAALPLGVTSRPLGELAVRGKERPLELYVLEADRGAGRATVAIRNDR